MKAESDDGEIYFNVQNLHSGFYTVKVSMNNKNYYRNFVIIE